jgi:hypothetical protein
MIMRAAVFLATVTAVLIAAGGASAQELIVSNGLDKPVVWTIDGGPGFKTAKRGTAVRPLSAGLHKVTASIGNKSASVEASRDLELQEDNLVTLGERRFWCLLVTAMDLDSMSMPLLIERRGDVCLALARDLK